MTCSIRQASSAAVSGETPRLMSQVESSVWRSVDHLCDLPSGIGEENVSFLINDDVSVLPKILHGNTDTGFGESQFCSNVDGTYFRIAFA